MSGWHGSLWLCNGGFENVDLSKKGALNLREEFETDGIRVKDRNRGGSVRVFPDLKEKTKQRT